MGGIFGGGGGNANSEPAALGLRVQTSAYGLAIPLVYGRTRVTANLLWYGDFVATAHETSGGKGGDSVLGITYTYTASMIFGLCEGEIAGIHSGWRDKEVLSLNDINSLFTFKNGTYPQTPWTWLTSKHPTEALGYQGVAYGAVATYDLGTTDSLPNHSFEVSGKLSAGAVGASKVITFTAPVFGALITAETSSAAGMVDQNGVSVLSSYGIFIITTGELVLHDKFKIISNPPQGLNTTDVYVVVVVEEVFSPAFGGASKSNIKIAKDVAGATILKFSGSDYFSSAPDPTLKKVIYSDAVVSTGHNLANDEIVYLSGAVATPFQLGVEYYVVNSAANTLGFSRERGGAAIVATSAGSGEMYTVATGGNPKNIIIDFLTSTVYGAEWGASKFGDLSAFSAFCIANGIFISPAYTEQRPAHEMLNELMVITNSAVYFSEGVLKITPLSEVDASGNGANYYAPNAPIYDLTDEDFLTTDGDPIKVGRNSTADSYNQIKVEFVNKNSNYNIEIATASDQASIDVYGLRQLDPIVAHMITDAATARNVAQMILQRNLFIRNTFEFVLSIKYCLLEPTDIVTINDADMGFDKYPVRIISTEENDDGSISVVAEDYPDNTMSAAIYPSDSGTGWFANSNESAGNVVAPAFYEVPATKSKTGLAVGVAVTGNNPAYGGCQVWVSYDGNTYKKLGDIQGGSRYGVTTGSTTSAVGQVQGVALAGNGGSIVGGSAIEAEKLATLCLVGDEYIAYTTAALLSANNYNLTLANRGAHKTVPAAHSAGSKFIRLDKSVLVGDDLELSEIGSVIYFKFCSFNQYGGGIQALTDVVGYSYTITGVMAKLPPTDVTGLSYTTDANGITFSWNDIADGDRKDYELRKGATWETAVSKGFFGSNSAIIPPQVAGASTWLVRARDFFGNLSTGDNSVAVTINAPSAPSVTSQVIGAEFKLSWSAPASGFTIDHYEIRTGLSWAAGVYVGTSGGQVYQAPINFSGSVNFMVAAVDIAGNVGAAGSAEIVVLLATAPTLTAQVIDNNILFYWNDTAATLPIETYELRKGDVFATAQVIGTKSGHFTSYFETSAGTFKYWIVPIDTAGNYGAQSSVSATMTQPPDYLLKADYDSILNGTISNAIIDSSGVNMPINLTETFGDHFTTRSWSTPQDQINAGYPLRMEPSAASGYYEETLDYGTTLAACKVTITPTIATVAGTPVITSTISLSLDGVSWTDYAGVTEVFGTNFRYTKARVAVTSTGGDDLVTLTALNIKLDVKLKNDAGSVAAVSTDNSAAITGAPIGGTTVLFNVPFVSITSIQVSAQGTTVAYTPIYDFTGSTVNPIGFKVYLYNSAGARVSGTVSWSAKGY